MKIKALWLLMRKKKRKKKGIPTNYQWRFVKDLDPEFGIAMGRVLLIFSKLFFITWGNIRNDVYIPENN